METIVKALRRAEKNATQGGGRQIPLALHAAPTQRNRQHYKGSHPEKQLLFL